jgi:hypothetical protein
MTLIKTLCSAWYEGMIASKLTRQGRWRSARKLMLK